MLGLSVRDLARLADVATDTVSRLERGEELKPRTADALRRALESAGAEFTNGDQPGIRLRRPEFAPLISISITAEAYAAIKATLPETADSWPAHHSERVRIWPDRPFVDRLRAMRGPGESYSDVILRLAERSK